MCYFIFHVRYSINIYINMLCSKSVICISVYIPLSFLYIFFFRFVFVCIFCCVASLHWFDLIFHYYFVKCFFLNSFRPEITILCVQIFIVAHLICRTTVFFCYCFCDGITINLLCFLFISLLIYVSLSRTCTSHTAHSEFHITNILSAI